MGLLESVADFQVEHSAILLLAALILTVGLALQIPDIRLETDFQASLPDSIDAIAAQDRVEANFGATDSIIILFQTNDEGQEQSFVSDVRDPRLIESMMFLRDELEHEPEVESTVSLASFFQSEPTEQQVKQVITNSEQAQQLVNRDYTATLMVVQLSEESTEENIIEATRVINENIEQTPKYPGVDVTVSGLPVIRTDLSRILVSDSVTTIFAASGLILLLLSITRGRAYGPITFVPLFTGLVWTLGAMALFNIPLTIATIALGAMILGLGVEYGSFITERISEEAEENGVEEAVKTSIPTTGKAIIGSSSTTVAGFSALLIATLSFIRDLGLTLALGIVLTVIAALVITPTLMIEYERWFR